jgi:8-oxo-dGTP diphosphatase
MGRWWQYVKTVLGVIFRHPIPGATLIPVLPDGKIVLIRRRDTGQWGLPGGLIDWGEDIASAAKRELAEETGLELLRIRRLVGVYSSMQRDPRIHSISILIEAEVQGDLAIQDVLEVLDVQAFSPQDLPLGNLSHDHDQQLGDYLQGLTVLA